MTAAQEIRTQKMSGGEAIVRSLLAHGVDTVFGLPGAQTYALFDALARAGEGVRVFTSRHEQTAGWMAFGYAKATGRTGVYSVVPGPGLLNSTAALCSAYGTSTPVVCVTGEVPSAFIGSGKGHLHELPDQLATARTLVKWAELIERPEDAPALVAEAFRQAETGRPRPVVLEMAWDSLDAVGDVELLPPAPPEAAPRPDPDLIERAARLFDGAENPMIMVGSGAFGAVAEVLELAERLQAPVVSFRSGRGIVSEDHYLGFNCAAGFRRWHETDVVLGIGSRMELQWFRWSGQPEGLRIVDVDIDPEQIERSAAELGIVADAREALRALTPQVRRERPSRRDEFEAVKAATNEAVQAVKPHAAFLAAIRDVLPRDGFFVEEVCQAGFASYYAFPVYEPRTFVTNGHQGTLGFGFPTALGVKAAYPERAVVSIAGDGGFLFGVGDLATAVQYGLDLVVIVFDNGAYGNVARDQERFFEGRLIASELRNPDFVALAESFGAAGYRARTADELRAALDRALAGGVPALIEVPVDRREEVSPWKFLMPGTPYGS